jgi:lipopolysaccharide transport system permease protein
MLQFGGCAAGARGSGGAARAALQRDGLVVARAQELFTYRSLVRNLVLKDLKVRYKHSFLGFLWSLLNPFLMMIVYTIVFTQLLKQNIPNFEVFIFVALLPWNWCARSLTSCATSLIDNSTIISKVYFPRVLLPVSVVVSEAVNFLLALPALFLMMIWYGVPFTPWVAYLPVLFAIQAMLLLGLGMFVAGMNVLFRDTGVILDVLILAWFFLTPIFYDYNYLVQLDAEKARWMRWLNPMASIIEQYRTILYKGGVPDLRFDLRTGATCFAILIVGYTFFTSLNRRLGEHL